MLLRESPTGAITNGNAPGDALVWNGLEWLPGPGGGGAGFTFPARVDCSVNSGRVDNANSDAPILRTLTAAPLAGGYNGGGTGSKSILGIDAGHLLPLAGLLAFTWTTKNLMPYNVAPWPLGYVNFLLDVNGNGTLWKVLVVDPQSVSALLQGVQTVNPDGSTTVSWTQAANLVLIVNDLPPVVPTVNLGPGWPDHGYTIASILASYPAARLSRANTLDGGLPKAQTLPPFLVINGDSTNNRTIATRLLGASLNGIQV